MSLHSKTGLLPTSKTITIKYQQKPHVHLKAVATPAPYTLKPFAGLYNPYPQRCSLLCNHPADNETKDLLKKAKDSWAIEGKALFLAEEAAAIRAALEKLQAYSENVSSNIYEVGDNMETVPEELFRRYTDTDSRPLTPAPTIVSNYTKTSAATRRCVTPDPIPTLETKEKTQLILDLRRSHSQETLSWFGGGVSNFSEQPFMRIQRAPTIHSSESSLLGVKEDGRTLKSTKPTLAKQQFKRPKSRIMDKSSPKQDLKSNIIPPQIILGDCDKVNEEDKIEEEESVMKRRGKKRHKKGRDSSRGPLPVQASIDPETQIATIGINSHNPSARPSLVSNYESEDSIPKPIEPRKTSLDVNSYLDVDILKQLRRELNEEVVDNEFNMKRRKALEEAMKTLRSNKVECEELKALQTELKIPKVDVDFWLSLPRMFSRSSARFELPVDSRMFSTMTPIDYVKDHVVVTSSRKLLYNYVFNRNKIDSELDENHSRRISGKNIRKALDEMMGKSLSEDQYEKFHSLVGWRNDDVFDFKTFCGICALCERLMAPEYYPLSKEEDPCQEIERVDFESLDRRLVNETPDPRLLKIMYAIRDS